jgi:hypothetical protein
LVQPHASFPPKCAWSKTPRGDEIVSRLPEDIPPVIENLIKEEGERIGDTELARWSRKVGRVERGAQRIDLIVIQVEIPLFL